MPHNVDIVPKKPSADLSAFSDAFKVGDKNLDAIIEVVEPFVNDAYVAMEDFLDAALTKKAEMKKAKDDILAARKAAAEASELAAVNAANEAVSNNMSGDYAANAGIWIGTYLGTKWSNKDN